jgi:hypothetical protein
MKWAVQLANKSLQLGSSPHSEICGGLWPTYSTVDQSLDGRPYVAAAARPIRAGGRNYAKAPPARFRLKSSDHIIVGSRPKKRRIVVDVSTCSVEAPAHGSADLRLRRTKYCRCCRGLKVTSDQALSAVAAGRGASGDGSGSIGARWHTKTLRLEELH